jgi:hypothetical protein
MYGRADGMPSFQLTMAVRDRIARFMEYIHIEKEQMEAALDHLFAS